MNIKEIKETRFTFRLSDIEKKTLKSAAHKMELSMSQFARLKTLGNV